MMSTKSFLITICLVLCVSIMANALKCSTCLGTKTSDCHDGKASSLLTQNCGTLPNYLSGLISLMPNINEDQNIIQACIQVISKTPFYATPASYRDCILVPKGIDACKALANLTQIENCKICLTDNCNNSPIF